MKTRLLFACLALTGGAFAAPPLAGSWSISPTGTAASSGELKFRVTPASGQDSAEIVVNVRNGNTDVEVARAIRQTMSSQLQRGHFSAQLGEGANVLVVDPRGKPSFSIELIDNDVDNLRVAVQSIEPAASPTVPAQEAPATTQPPATPPAPGQAAPANTPASQPQNPAPVPSPNGSPAAPLPNPAPNGSPAAPPPNATPGGTPNLGAPVPNPTPNGSPAAPPPNATPGGAPASAPPPN